MNNIEQHDIDKAYNDLKQILVLYVDLNNIVYTTSKDAPSTFSDIKEQYETHRTLSVYNGGDHGYLGEHYNTMFRAVHDYMHISHNLSFKYGDERQLSDITAQQFSAIGYHMLCMTHWECYMIRRVIDAEIRGQIDYYETNKSYVIDQKKFINDYLKVG